MPIAYPDTMLEVRVQDSSCPHLTTALCAGYELKEWRAKQLAEHIFEWIPFVALDQESQLSFAAHNFMELLKTACKHIYETSNVKSRGELGEILLHIACVQHFEAFPVLCKLILKTSPNDTVKGFDGVFVVETTNDFEIWLGESKFYSDGKRAIKDAIASIKLHILPNFINAEKAMIVGHIDDMAPYSHRLKKILKQKTSADELLRRAVFPILVAYDSDTCANYHEVADDFVAQLKLEVSSLSALFNDHSRTLQLRFRLILVPLNTKKLVIEYFDKKVQAFV